MIRRTSASSGSVALPRSLGDVLENAAKEFGNRQALFFEGHWSSYDELNRESTQFADGLARLDVDSEARVVLHVPNSRDWIIAYYGVAKTGAVVVPVDAMLTPEEVTFIVRDSGATVLITGLEDAAALEGIRNETSLSTLILAFEARMVDDAIVQSDVVTSGDPDCQQVIPDLDQVSSICYTSGTTGKPKGAMLSHGNVLLSAALTAEAHGRAADDVFLSALPCTHVYGNAIVHASMMVGGRLVLLRRFDAETVLSSIQKHHVTMFEGVPTMYFRILSHSRLGQYDLGSLTRCTVGGQSTPVESIAEVERIFRCPLLELWGMTELAGPAISHRFDDPSPPGSIGRAFPGTEVRIESEAGARGDADSGIGELCVKGPLVMQGYLNRSEATAKTIDKKGWLHTGDLARVDEQGNSYIVGRQKEVIITAGYNVYPSEIEQAIAEHPSVEMVAVGKSLDEDKCEIAVAYVVLKPGHTALAGEIEQAARNKLAPYKAPRRVFFVEDLPKTGSGKIMRHRLEDAKQVSMPQSASPPPPSYQFVRTEIVDRVGIVVMHGPKSINALNEEFILELVDALHRFDRDPDVRCMILRGGTDKYFSVGADINEMAKRTFSDALDQDFFTTGWARIAQCRKPLIAAVNGLALGGGCELALMCDIIVAGDTAELGLPEVRLGIIPGAGGTQRLARQIGKSRAMEMILTGDANLSASEALALKLVARVVPPNELLDTALTMARKIAANSTLSVRMAKEAINRVYESSLSDGLLFERRLFYSSLATQDKSEGTKAFIERREPFFKDK